MFRTMKPVSTCVDRPSFVHVAVFVWPPRRSSFSKSVTSCPEFRSVHSVDRPDMPLPTMAMRLRSIWRYKNPMFVVCRNQSNQLTSVGSAGNMEDRYKNEKFRSLEKSAFLIDLRNDEVMTCEARIVSARDG